MQHTGKRCFDFIVSLVCVFIGAPIFLIIAVLVFIFLGRPVFFVQKRPGYQSRPFNLIKFRTMKISHDLKGNLLPDRQRLTMFGRFLRSSSLDEIPELLNVIRGDMSIVGPRPLLMQYLPLYNRTQMRRHEVKPGITGWAQVNGRNELCWQKRFEMDVWYVDNFNMMIDLKIIMLTILQVLKRQGVSQKGEATVKFFEGNNSEGGEGADHE